MSASARLQNRLRSSFSSSSQLGLGGVSLTSTTPPISVTPTTHATSTQDQLEILDKVLTEVEQIVVPSTGVFAQAIPQATLQATDTLNPSQPATTIKEVESSISPDISPIEAGAGLQQVEYELSAELPIEVESYLQKVDQRQEQIPQEIVIADGSTMVSTTHQPAQKPVIVLPITQKEEQEGQKKPLHWSFRWLAQWSQKIMKMFSSRVIYRQEVSVS